MSAPWDRPRLAALLGPLGLLVGGLAALRRRLHARGWLRGVDLGIPTISVGNLTVGGTGKTPMTARLLEWLPPEARPALVLSRGYGDSFALDGVVLNDEGHLLRRARPEAIQAQGADRVAAARPHLAEGRVRTVVLDDGAQHLRIRRDLEILLLDARSLEAPRRVLPAGPWREGLGAARGADALVLTRADEVPIERLAALHDELARRIPGVPVFTARHRPLGLRPLGGGELASPERLRGRRVLLVSAIADPGALRRTVLSLGAEVVGEEIRRDHALWTSADLAAIEAMREATAAEELVTTAKDAPKLQAAGARADLEVLEIELDLGPDEAAFRRLVEHRLSEARDARR